MGRIEDLSAHLLGCDFLSKIDTHSMELSDHCSDLVGSPGFLADLKFLTPAQ